MSELEDVRKEARAMADKRRALEARHTEILDRLTLLRAGKVPVAPATSGGIFTATRLVSNVVNVATAERVSLNPGDLVCAPSINAARRFEGRRVVFCSTADLKQLLADDAITPTN